MNYIDGPMDPEHNQEEMMVIDWVNSLDIPSCTLADDIHDLKSGCVVADIVSWLFDLTLPSIQRDISSRSDAISNWRIILDSLRKLIPPKFIGRPEEFLDNSEKLLRLLDHFSTIKKETQAIKRNASGVTKTSESVTPVREVQQVMPRAVEETPNKKPEQVRYEPRPVAETLKEGLVGWLEELHIVRKDTNTLQLIPSICRTGVLFCDLVNRIEGRTEVIKGIERNPKNRTQALANLNKVLEHLRSFPKMNSRYLWAAKDVIEGDENVIWGLLEDIKGHFAAVSKPKPQISTSLSVISANVSIPTIASHESIKIPRPVSKEPQKSLRSYSSSMKKFSNKSSSITTPRMSRPPSSRSIKSETVKTQSFHITSEMKRAVLGWIEAIGIEYQPTSNPYVDILKNGLLVCELIRILEGESVKMNINPRSGQAVYENFDRALNIFRNRRVEGLNSAISSAENMADNVEIVYAFIYALMSAYPNAAPIEYHPCVLPYGPVGIRKLEVSVVTWVDSLNLLEPSPQYFAELVPELKKGVLLCVVTSKVTLIKIYNIVPDPKTEQSALNNIRKSLEVLRKLPKMSQKFTWSEKDIYKGNLSTLLGLLEDLMRWADGLPLRRNGADYHRDGPYIRPANFDIKTLKTKEETFNTTFGSSTSPKHEIQAISEEPEIDEYAQWLYSVGADFPRSLNFKDEHIPEFTTGVLICNLIQTLEKLKIPGVEREPRTRVSAIQNINKALVILKKKPAFPKELYGCAEEIFLGNGAVIRTLMHEIMRIYRSREKSRVN